MEWVIRAQNLQESWRTVAWRGSPYMQQACRLFARWWNQYNNLTLSFNYARGNTSFFLNITLNMPIIGHVNKKAMAIGQTGPSCWTSWKGGMRPLTGNSRSWRIPSLLNQRPDQEIPLAVPFYFYSNSRISVLTGQEVDDWDGWGLWPGPLWACDCERGQDKLKYKSLKETSTWV